MPAARADDSAKISARVEAWGRNCKNTVAVNFPKATMADIAVELGAADQKGIDSGETTLKQVTTSGLSFNWTFKNHTDYCNTTDSGKITEFVKGQ